MTRFLAATLFCMTPLLLAENGHAVSRGVPRTLDAIESFEGITPDSLLRGLYDQAVAALEDYIEVEGRLPQDDGAQAGEFRLRLFPQGKSHSQEHFAAEGSFRLSPDTGQRELSLRFKSAPRPQASQPNGDSI